MVLAAEARAPKSNGAASAPTPSNPPAAIRPRRERSALVMGLKSSDRWGLKKATADKRPDIQAANQPAKQAAVAAAASRLAVRAGQTTRTRAGPVPRSGPWEAMPLIPTSRVGIS